MDEEMSGASITYNHGVTVGLHARYPHTDYVWRIRRDSNTSNSLVFEYLDGTQWVQMSSYTAQQDR